MPPTFEDIESRLTADMRRTILRLLDARRGIEGECWFMVIRTLDGASVQSVGQGDMTSWSDLDPGWLEDLCRLGLLATMDGQGEVSYRITGDGERFGTWLIHEAGSAVTEVERQVSSLIDSAGFAERHPAAAQGLREAIDLTVTPTTDANTVRSVGVLCRHALQDVAGVLVGNDLAEKPADALRSWRDGRHIEERQAAVVGALVELTRHCLAVDQGAAHVKESPERFEVPDEVRRAVFLTAVTCFEIDRAVRLSTRGS